MYITLRELRQIIGRSLREAPLADILPTAKWTGDSEPTPQFVRQLDKFHRTDLYKQKALKAFSFFDLDVYILPLATGKMSSGYTDEQDFRHYTKMYNDFIYGHGRVNTYTFEEAQKYLSGTDIDVDDLRSKLNDNSTILVIQVRHFIKDQLPTPWMVVHAIFDDVNGEYFEAEFVRDNYALQGMIDDVGISIKEWNSILTMGSARIGKIGNIRDLISEIMTQDVITSSGFNWNHRSLSPEVNSKIEAIAEYLRGLNLHDRVMDLLKGKIVTMELSAF